MGEVIIANKMVKKISPSTKRKGTKVAFVADEVIFKKYKYRNEYVVKMLKNYCYLNRGLTIYYNGEKYVSQQIDSIINQSEVNVHFYISDDGSTDNTLNIIHDYKHKYPKKFKSIFIILFFK